MNVRKYFLWGCVIASLALLVLVSWKRFGPSSSTTGSTEIAADTGPAPGNTTATTPTSATRQNFKLLTAENPETTLPAPTEPAVPWDEKLDAILRPADVPESVKATNLLALFARLSGEPQEEVARHMVNLLSDEQFPAAAPWLVNTNTPEPVLSILMNDLLNRAEELKLPLFLEVARVEGHPNAEEARSYLEVYVDHDYGTNWEEWAKAVEKHLKEKPDGQEPAEK